RDVRAPERTPSPRTIPSPVPHDHTHHLLDTHVRADVQPTGGAAVAAHPVDEKIPTLKMATSGLQTGRCGASSRWRPYHGFDRVPVP
ncbi:hypothetical protein ACWGQ5_33080, partial [Streptomyces sp. NPDC055722]